MAQINTVPPTWITLPWETRPTQPMLLVRYGSDCKPFPGFQLLTVTNLSIAPTQLATILTSDRLSLRNRALIEAAFDASRAEDGAVEAMRVAQKLIVTSPEFHSLGKVDLKNVTRDATTRPTSDGTVPEYKAIVHLSLFGGLDSMNTLVPHPEGCSSLYEEYYAIRGEGLRLETSEMIKIDATNSTQPCTHFGLHASLPGVAQLYNEKEVLFFANSGHLQKNVNRKNFQTETQAQLFGHHTMTTESFYVDAFRAREETGTFIGDMFQLCSSTNSHFYTQCVHFTATCRCTRKNDGCLR